MDCVTNHKKPSSLGLKSLSQQIELIRQENVIPPRRARWTSRVPSACLSCCGRSVTPTREPFVHEEDIGAAFRVDERCCDRHLAARLKLDDFDNRFVVHELNEAAVIRSGRSTPFELFLPPRFEVRIDSNFPAQQSFGGLMSRDTTMWMSNCEARTSLSTAPGTDYLVIFSKREGSVQLRARKLFGPLDFRVRAWTLANHKAQELGWFEPDFGS